MMLWLLSSSSLQAQYHLKFQHYSVENGLVNNTINCMAQDHYGFMWFGTGAGLSKFDGVSFTNYTSHLQDSTGLPTGNITALEKGLAKGDMWIGTSQGLGYYKAKQDQIVRQYQGKRLDVINEKRVQALEVTPDSSLIIGTADGLIRFNVKTNQLTHYRFNEGDKKSNNILSLLAAGDKLWVGTHNGLYIIDENDQTTLIKGTAQKKVPDIEQGTNGQYYCLIEQSGLYKIDSDRLSEPLLKQKVGYKSEIAVHRDNILITQGKELVIVSTKENEPKTIAYDKLNAHGLNSKSLSTVFVDAHHNIWIGTVFSGINFYDVHQKAFHHYAGTRTQNGPVSSKVRSFYEDQKGNLWVGTKTNGGLNLFDKTTGNFTRYSIAPEKLKTDDLSVFSITEPYPGELWIGTHKNGLLAFDTKSQTFSPLFQQVAFLQNASVYDMAATDSTVWIGCYGLARYDQRTNRVDFSDTSLCSKSVRAIYQDRSGDFWLGTAFSQQTPGCLTHWDSQTRHFTHYRHQPQDASSLASNRVSCILEDALGRLWVGTFESGLSFLDRQTNTFRTFTTAQGLCDNNIQGLLEDEQHNLWITTRNGLSKFTPPADPLDTTQTGIFMNYYHQDGLQGNAFNKNAYLKLSNGEMLIGGDNGFNLFHPDSIQTNTVLPQVVVTAFTTLESNSADSTLQIRLPTSDTTLTLRYNQSSFSVSFAGISYTSTEHQQYAYRLDEADSAGGRWHRIGHQRELLFASLAAGRYTLSVRAANADGRWNPQAARLHIRILPPPWERPEAYLLYACLVALVLYLVFRFLKARHHLALQQVEMNRQQALDKLQQAAIERQHALDKMKLHFFTNISHELRTPLSLITGPIDNVISKKQYNEYQLSLAKKNADYLLKLTDQLLDFRKLEAGNLLLELSRGDIIACINNSIASFQPFAEQKNIRLSTTHSVPNFTTDFDSDKVEKIIRNLLSNAFKFTPEEGTINVTVKISSNVSCEALVNRPPAQANALTDGCVSLSVQDTGPGIPAKHLDKIFDRFYTVPPTSTTTHNSGIGLAFTKELVHLQGGSISVESKVGKGATFTVILPLTKSGTHTAISENRDLAPVKVQKEDQAGLKKRILVVEDNLDLRNYLVNTMADEYEVITAANGKNGLAKTLETFPALIISDVMMPEMDGNELNQQVKHHLLTSHIPVILLTARSAMEHKLESLQLGADDYITKPFSVEELKLRVRNLIASRQKLRKTFSQEPLLKPSDIAVTPIDQEFLAKALEIIEKNIDNLTFKADQLAKEMSMSRSVFYRKFFALVDANPGDFIRTYRLKKAALLLEKTDATISDISTKVGYSDPSGFIKAFEKHFQTSPTQYRKTVSSLY